MAQATQERTGRVKGGLDVQDAVDLIVRECLETGRAPAKATTDDMLELLTDDASRTFAREGWVQAVNLRLHKMRDLHCPEDEEQANNPAPGPAGRNPRTYQSYLDIRLVGAGEDVKPVREFDAEDLAAFQGRAGSQKIAWSRREKWAKDTVKLMDKHGVETVGELPAEALQDIEAQMRKVWGSR